MKIMPTEAQLAEEFGLTRQAFNYQKNHKPELFKVYCDAYKYRVLIKDLSLSKLKGQNAREYYDSLKGDEND